jgi:hypothetical protein
MMEAVTGDDGDTQLVKEVFDLLDANHDGKLSKVELLKGLMGNKEVKQKITMHEKLATLTHPSMYATSFSELDTGHKGYITIQELLDFCHDVHANAQTVAAGKVGASPATSPRQWNLPEREPTRRIGKDDVVTPDDILHVAMTYGIDPETEPHLLWIPHEALNTPLAPDWRFEWNAAEGRELYRNTFTNDFSTRHPGDKRSMQILAQQRAISQAGNFALDGAWMCFYDLDGKPYHYSFTEHVLRANKPTGSTLIERPDGLIGIQIEHDYGSDEKEDDMMDASRSQVMWKSIHQSSGVPDVEVMEFKSWWTEAKSGFDRGSQRRYVELKFQMATGNFQVLLDRSDKMYTLSHIQGLHGPLQCWDLHVGARVNVLGRSTTLMQASGATLEWLEAHTKRLSKIKGQLEKEITKYDRRMSKKFVKPARKATVARGGQKVGTTCLRKLMQDVEVRRTALAKYRPKVADKICGLCT